jgi:hypothetical protein
MDNPLRLAWNANGLTQHAEELRTFVSYHNIDVMLISETHFTEKNYFILPYYSVYHTNHPVRTARGGSAIIIQPWDPDSLCPDDGKSSKLLNAFTYAISPRANPPTGPPTITNCSTLWTFVSQRVYHQHLLQQRLALIYRQTTPRSWLSSQPTRCHQ